MQNENAFMTTTTTTRNDFDSFVLRSFRLSAFLSLSSLPIVEIELTHTSFTESDFNVYWYFRSFVTYCADGIESNVIALFRDGRCGAVSRTTDMDHRCHAWRSHDLRWFYPKRRGSWNSMANKSHHSWPILLNWIESRTVRLARPSLIILIRREMGPIFGWQTLTSHGRREINRYRSSCHLELMILTLNLKSCEYLAISFALRWWLLIQFDRKFMQNVKCLICTFDWWQMFVRSICCDVLAICETRLCGLD